MSERTFGVVFFIAMLILSVGVLLWVFLFNRGTLLVRGDAPFTVNVAGEEFECAQSPCSIKLKPQEYRVRVGKTGYQEVTESVEVNFNEEEELAVAFAFIPTLHTVEELPEDLRTHTDQILKYLITEQPSQKVPADVAIVLRSDPEQLKAQNMYWHSIDGETLITQFKKPLQNPTFLSSPSAQFVILVTREASARNFTLIDMIEKKRTQLTVPDVDLRWVSDSFIGWQESDLAQLYSIETKEQYSLPADVSNIFELSDGRLLYVTNRQVNQKTFSDYLGSPSELIDPLNKSVMGTWAIRTYDPTTRSDAILIPMNESDSSTLRFVGTDSRVERIYLEVERPTSRPTTKEYLILDLVSAPLPFFP